MKKIFTLIFGLFVILASTKFAIARRSADFITGPAQPFNNIINAADFGFLPTTSGVQNTRALQTALDKGGTIHVSLPGTYKLAGTVYIGDNTSLIFENAVYLEKVAEKGMFAQVILNKGALSRTYNRQISISGLNLKVNGVEKWFDEVYGLRGQLACVFKSNGVLELVIKNCKDKFIFLKTSGSIELGNNFKATITPGPGKIIVDSDLTGVHLKPKTN